MKMKFCWLLTFLVVSLMIVNILSKTNSTTKEKKPKTDKPKEKTKTEEKKPKTEKPKAKTEEKKEKTKPKKDKEQIKKDKEQKKADKAQKEKDNKEKKVLAEIEGSKPLVHGENNVIELKTNDKHNPIYTEKHGKFLVFLYKKNNLRTKEFNTLFNKISIAKGKGLDDIKFIRANAKDHSILKKDLAAFEYPSIFLVANDHDAVYEYEKVMFKYDDFFEEHLVNWIHKMIKIKIQEVTTMENFNELKQRGSNILLIGDAEKFKVPFNLIAKYSKKYFRNAFWTKSPEFFSKFNIKQGEMDAVAYFTENGKLTPGERMNFSSDEITKEEIHRIAEVYSRKPFTNLDNHHLESVLHNGLKTVFVIHENLKTDTFMDVNSILRSLSLKYREDYWFLNTFTSHHISDILLESFHIEDNHLPAIVMVGNKKTNSIDLDLFVFPYDLPKTQLNIETWILDHKAGKLQRMIMSTQHDDGEPKHKIYSDEDKLVLMNENINANFTRTRNNTKLADSFLIDPLNAFIFKDHVFNRPGKDVVLFVCSESSNCLKAEKRYRRVVKKLARTTTIKWTTINYLENELEGVDITNVPALLIVPDVSENTGKKIYRFDQEFNVNDMIEFIKIHVKNQLMDIIIYSNDAEKDKQDLEKKVSIKKKSKDEEKSEVEMGHAVGNGFSRSFERFILDFTDNNGGMIGYKEEYEHYTLDHDMEDYDNDETLFYELKSRNKYNHDEL